MRRRRTLRPLVIVSSLAPGGAERVTVSFLRRLRSAGHDVPVCTVSSRQDGALAEELRQAGVARYDLAASRLADGRAVLRLIRLIRGGRYDLLHAHGQDAAVLAALACAVCGVPLVVTRHVLDEPVGGWRQRARMRATVGALRRAHTLVAVSSATAVSLARTTGIPSERIRVIRNGIELERFGGRGADARLRLRSSLGMQPGHLMVLVPAVLREGKGHDVLLDAVPRIREQLSNARLFLAGSGPLEPVLRERARAHGGAVAFLGHRDDMPDLMDAADLVVLPSLSEALPTALMEAAAAGRAVVSTCVGGVNEVVEDGRTGVLVPPADAAALAAAVTAMLGDRSRAHALGMAARGVAHERFGIETQVAHTWAVWRETATGVDTA
jgi:glycosyltransferase involved in cell wall biosynthesis